MTAEAAAFAAPVTKAERAARLRVVAGWLWSGALLAVLTFLVLYPVAMLLLGALTNTNPVVDGFGVFDLSLDNFVSVLGNANVHHALANSLIACTGGTALAVAIASEASLATRAGFFVQGLVWLALLVAAVVAIRRRDRARHARLMLAMAAVASGAVWLRLVLSGAVALELPFDTVYPVAAWSCWIIPLAATLIPRLVPFPNRIP